MAPTRILSRQPNREVTDLGGDLRAPGFSQTHKDQVQEPQEHDHPAPHQHVKPQLSHYATSMKRYKGAASVGAQ
jgi:hypothetical protein